MKVGILGGSFNPAHLGHIHLSKIAIKKLDLNQLWWIPTSQNPFKQKNDFLNFEERVKNWIISRISIAGTILKISFTKLNLPFFRVIII